MWTNFCDVTSSHPHPAERRRQVEDASRLGASSSSAQLIQAAPSSPQSNCRTRESHSTHFLFHSFAFISVNKCVHFKRCMSRNDRSGGGRGSNPRGGNVRAAICASVHRGESNKTQADMSRHKTLNAHLELLSKTFSSSLSHFERTTGDFRIKISTSE